jgi:hypothetical protein
MKSSKLVETLGALTKPELRELDKFLRSPYFNQRSDVLQLKDYLVANLGKDEKALSKPVVFAAIFPESAYDEKLIRYIMSFLYQLVKNYLLQKELESQPAQSQLIMVRALRKRGVQRVFDAEWQQAEKNLQSHPHKNFDAHFFNYSLHNEKLMDAISKSRGSTPGFRELSSELTKFFIANTLHQSCLALSYQTIAKLDFTPDLLPQVLEKVESSDYSDTPAILIYYHCYQMLVGHEPLRNFQLLRQDIQEFGHCFPKSELKDLHVLALNFCIRNVNEGREQFKYEAFELYKSGLANGVFIEDNQLSRFTYKNIVAIGLGLNEYDWVRSFIEAYMPFLSKKYRESTYCFNLALYHFKKEEYSEAMSLLQQVGTDDLLNNLNARRMLLRIYYDLGETEALYSLLDSFQTYIYRKKDLGYHRDLYLNLIRSIRKLLNIDLSNKQQTEQLRQEIESKDRIAEKQWLLEKLTS